MRLAAAILLGVIVGGLVVGSILRRLGVEGGAGVSFFAAMTARLAASIAFVAIGVRAAQRGGGWYDALAAAMLVLALAGFVLTGLLTWAWVTSQRDRRGMS